MRISAWLFSQDCATKTASRPNTTANAIITMVLVRTRLPSGLTRFMMSFVSSGHYRMPLVLNW